MINITNGQVQGPNSVAVSNGSVTFTLSQDANVIASPYGQVAAGVTVRFFSMRTGTSPEFRRSGPMRNYTRRNLLSGELLGRERGADESHSLADGLLPRPSTQP